VLIINILIGFTVSLPGYRDNRVGDTATTTRLNFFTIL